MRSSLSLTSRVVVTPGHLSCDLAGDVVVLNVADGFYYGLNEVAATVWQLLQEPRTVRQIRDALMAEYEVEAEQCERDLLVLLADLVTRGLVTDASEEETAERCA
jgi:hypothetical protein